MAGEHDRGYTDTIFDKEEEGNNGLSIELYKKTD